MLHFDYANVFLSFPPEIATLLIAMLPIAELRAALPIALTVFHLPVVSALIWSIVGNLMPAILLLHILKPLAAFLEKHIQIGHRFFTWLSHRTENKFVSNKLKYGSFIALMLFVAIPLPITGAWTGALAAYLTGISFKRAVLAISLGVLIAAAIVLILTEGITSIL